MRKNILTLVIVATSILVMLDATPSQGGIPAKQEETPNLTRRYDSTKDVTIIQTKPRALSLLRGRAASVIGSVIAMHKGKSVTETPPALLISTTTVRVIAQHAKDWQDTPMVIVCDGKRIAAHPVGYQVNSSGGMDYETITFGLETQSLLPVGDASHVTAEVGTDEFLFTETFKLGISEMMSALGAK